MDSEKKSDELITQLTTFSQAVTALAEIPQQLRETSDPEALKDSSKLKIASAFYDGLITEAQMTQMMGEVEASFAFNPAVTTSYGEILSNVKKGTLLPYAIISRGLYIVYPLFENNFFTFKEVF